MTEETKFQVKCKVRSGMDLDEVMSLYPDADAKFVRGFIEKCDADHDRKQELAAVRTAKEREFAESLSSEEIREHEGRHTRIGQNLQSWTHKGWIGKGRMLREVIKGVNQ